MSRPTRGRTPAVMSASMEQVSGNAVPTLAASAAMYRQHRAANPNTDRNTIAKPWQIEAYRHVNICGEARYAATLFAAIAGRAEIGIGEAQGQAGGKANWTKDGPEVEALAQIAPTVRERSKLIRDYMMHRTIAGECYLIARKRVDTDPGYIAPPDGFEGTWEDYARAHPVDLFDPEPLKDLDPNEPLWEIVAVTELQKVGKLWKVRHDNDIYLELTEEEPVIRLWNPDPENRREAWSPYRSMLPTLREIEWLTMHIFTQVRSRLLSAGVWFLPNNLTYPPPPPDAVDGGADAIALMNEAEKFGVSLAASSMQMLDGDEVSFPSIVMADADALEAIDQSKLIKFWSEIDDKAMLLRSDAVRRFALGMDLPPEQVLGSSGLAVSNSGGSAGSVNHWGVWANEEQTISAHVEPALDDFVGVLTVAIIRTIVENTTKVVAYDTASLRMRQDRSKESIELHNLGLLSGEKTLKENGFDPEFDMMDEAEFKRWLLIKLVGGSPSPEMITEAVKLLGVVFNPPEPKAIDSSRPADGQPGTAKPRNLDDHPQQGPPQEDHEHKPAPFGAREAAAEVLVLRALEKAGNVVLNSGKRGKDRDRVTPPHMAHVVNEVTEPPGFDFSLVPTVFSDLTAAQRAEMERQLGDLCTNLYLSASPYTREALRERLKGA